jgi:hypothetical protein
MRGVASPALAAVAALAAAVVVVGTIVRLQLDAGAVGARQEKRYGL